jgi:hypothetical protein
MNGSRGISTPPQFSSAPSKVAASGDAVVEERHLTVEDEGSAGFRPGRGADLIAARLKERRIIELEKQVEVLKSREEALLLDINPVASILRGSSVPLRLKPVRAFEGIADEPVDFGCEAPATLGGRQRELIPIAQAIEGTTMANLFSKKHQEPQPSKPSSRRHWRRQSPLAALQGCFEANSDGLMLAGEPSREISLMAPFSTAKPTKHLPARPHSTTDDTTQQRELPRTLKDRALMDYRRGPTRLAHDNDPRLEPIELSFLNSRPQSHMSKLNTEGL